MLRKGHHLGEESNGAGSSGGKERHRKAERTRRAAIRDLQEEISAYFLVPGRKKISVGELLLFGGFTD